MTLSLWKENIDEKESFIEAAVGSVFGLSIEKITTQIVDGRATGISTIKAIGGVTDSVTDGVTDDVTRGDTCGISSEVARGLTGCVTDGVTGGVTSEVARGVTGCVTDGVISEVTRCVTGGVTYGANSVVTEDKAGGIAIDDVTDDVTSDVTVDVTIDAEDGITSSVTGGITGGVTDDITSSETNDITYDAREGVSGGGTGDACDVTGDALDVTGSARGATIDVFEAVKGNFANKIHSGVTGGVTEVITVDCYLDSDGVLNGPFRLQRPETDEVQIGLFKNGKTAGNCWIIKNKKVTSFFILFFGLSGFWTRKKRVKNDCTLSADYYNIN